LIQVRAALDLALVFARALSREELQERGLARAVRPDDADAVAALHQEIDAVEERAAAARAGEALRFEDDVARAWRRDETKGDALGDGPHVLGSFDRLELLEHLAPALRLLRLLTGDVLADEVFG